MSFLLLHNPQCSKSRQAKEYLAARGIDFTVREYLRQPLSLDELRILKKRLGREPGEWLRWHEPEAKQAGISKNDAPLVLLQAMATHPRLMERPILIHGDAAALGRPGPEDLESLLH